MKMNSVSIIIPAFNEELSIKELVAQTKRLYPKYEITHHLKMAADFGVPQTRERVFIVGVRKDLNVSFHPPVETHSADGSDGRTIWVTSKKAIGDLEKKNTVPNQDQVSRAKRYGSHCQGILHSPVRKWYRGVQPVQEDRNAFQHSAGFAGGSGAIPTYF